jgi:hypothetical protein
LSASKLCERTEQVEDQRAARRRGVHAFERAEADAFRLEPTDSVDEVRHRAAEAVEFQTTSASPERT